MWDTGDSEVKISRFDLGCLKMFTFPTGFHCCGYRKSLREKKTGGNSARRQKRKEKYIIKLSEERDEF